MKCIAIGKGSGCETETAFAKERNIFDFVLKAKTAADDE